MDDEARLHRGIVERFIGPEDNTQSVNSSQEGGEQPRCGSKDELRDEARRHTDRVETKKVGGLKGLGWRFNVTPFEETDFAHMKGMLREIKDSDLPLVLKMMCDQAPTLVNMANATGGKGELTNKCPLCKRYQPTADPRHERCAYTSTQRDSVSQNLFHILNGCPYALESGRYTKRHDDVLRLIEDRIRIACEREKKEDSTLSYTLWADVKGLDSAGSYPQHISEAFRAQYRPDIMLVKSRGERKKLVFVELSCPFETVDNLKFAHQRKVSKYTPFIEALRAEGNYAEVELHCIEVGSRGYLANSFQDIHQYLECGRGHPKMAIFRRRRFACSCTSCSSRSVSRFSTT